MQIGRQILKLRHLFRFLKNHSLTHELDLDLKAMPVTTVSVYNKTSNVPPLNTGQTALEIGLLFPPMVFTLLTPLISSSPLVTDYGAK